MNKLISKLLFGLSLGLLMSLQASATDLKVGDKAPNFKLQATDGHYYQLSDYLGKQTLVLAWYPMANTRGCTLECKSLVQKGHLIREYKAVYMMASVDDLEDNQKFAEEQKADFPMLSDPTKETAKAYDVLNLVRVASRVTFYIGEDGTILKIDEDINPETAAEDIAANLNALGIAKAE
ncbi:MULTISPECIES: peroxiredoxin family protein [Shewanella]|uniref:thioredoxin-dependent peroxiredoxin n=1 Tax=Shewanella marisflavi TaxID=260364 RepID=A0AAC9XMA5_9GAMM|nr:MULTISPECIES: redoxin domain-containing protein [Shewanella]ASJ95676.1 peroxiredoxin [Shewanella marisflavi]MCL1041660.1 peroxiredoxin family protein [Shewanella marisflavi]QDF74242.1 peroxiredoxin family protein [Shewanella marisflavi]